MKYIFKIINMKSNLPFPVTKVSICSIFILKLYLFSVSPIYAVPYPLTPFWEFIRRRMLKIKQKANEQSGAEWEKTKGKLQDTGDRNTGGRVAVWQVGRLEGWHFHHSLIALISDP